MTKSEPIQALAEQQNLPFKDSRSIVETILETMTEALVRGDNVEIRGSGASRFENMKPIPGETL